MRNVRRNWPEIQSTPRAPRHTRGASLALLLACLTLLPPPAAQAGRRDDPPPPQGCQYAGACDGPTGDDEDSSPDTAGWREACRNIPKKAEVKARQKIDPGYEPPPRFALCDSVYSNREARTRNRALAVSYGVVVGVCTAACFVNHPAMRAACMGSNGVVALTDVALTKEMMALMTSLGSMTLALSMGNNSGRSTASTSEKGEQTQESSGRDTGSCITAASAALQVAFKGKAAKDSDKSRKKAIQEVVKSSGSNEQTLAAGGGGFTTESGNGGDSGGGGAGGELGSGSTSGPGTGPESDLPRECQGLGPRSPGLAQVSCALALDSNLPGELLRNPNLDNELKKNLGFGLDDISEQVMSDPTGAAASLMSASAPDALKAALKGEVDQFLADRLDSMPEGGVGRMVGGGGGRGGGDSGADPFASALTGMLSKLLPPGAEGEAGADPHLGVKKVAQANLKRGPAAVAEDRSLGIFDRVSYRYYSLAYQGFGGAVAPPAAAPAPAPARGRR